MKRSGRIPRYTELPRSGPVNPVNRARRKKERERGHGSDEFRAWIKQQPCVVCGRTPCDAAHLKSGGIGRKDDVSGVVPLCSSAVGYVGHHDEYDGRKHAGGKQTFAKNHPDVDLWAHAARIQALWQSLHVAGFTHVAAIVPNVLRGISEQPGREESA